MHGHGLSAGLLPGCLFNTALGPRRESDAESWSHGLSARYPTLPYPTLPCGLDAESGSHGAQDQKEEQRAKRRRLLSAAASARIRRGMIRYLQVGFETAVNLCCPHGQDKRLPKLRKAQMAWAGAAMSRSVYQPICYHAGRVRHASVWRPLHIETRPHGCSDAYHAFRGQPVRLQVVVDLSRAAAISDMRPNRLAVIGGILQASALPSISAANIYDASTFDFIILTLPYLQHPGNAWQLS